MFFETARVVHALGVAVTDRKQLMKLTFSESIRGSIREAPNIVTWIVTLGRMQKYGIADPAAVVSDWNSTCTASAKLKGAMATAVQLVIERMPQPLLHKLIDHVSRFSWPKCMLFDDSLSSKKIRPALPTSACAALMHIVW